MTACFLKQVLTISNTDCLEAWHSNGNDSLLYSAFVKSQQPEKLYYAEFFRCQVITLSIQLRPAYVI